MTLNTYYSFILLILFTFTSFAQLEDVVSVNVGGAADFTLQPYVPQVPFSRTQTIYHTDRTQFKGEITELRFRLIFSQGTTTPSPNENIILRLGVTDKYEFTGGEDFIGDEELTTIAVSTNFLLESFVPYWVLTLEESFYYDGTQNLVVDVESISGVPSTDNFFGFRGEENFNNPPTRSRVSITEMFDDTDDLETSIVFQNSMAFIQFRGDLERCIPVFSSSISTTDTTANIQLLENSAVLNYVYQVVEEGEEPSDEDYLSSESPQLFIENLAPSTNYVLYVRSDCEEFQELDTHTYPFTTRSSLIAPDFYSDFEEISNTYVLTNGAELSPIASNDSENGVLMKGKPFPDANQWNSSAQNIFHANQNFVQSIVVDVDLTDENLSHPVLSFDLRQTANSRLRVLVLDYPNSNVSPIQFPLDFVYEYSSAFAGEFRKVVFDLSPYVGELKTIRIEHVSRTEVNQSHVDNLRIEESTCFENFVDTEIEVTSNSISLTWNEDIENESESSWEYFIVPHDAAPLDVYQETSQNSFEISGLNIATAYNLYVRKLCTDGISPWKKFFVSTDPLPLELPYQSNFSSQVVEGDYFSILHAPSSNYNFTFSNNFVVLTQRQSASKWNGGTNPSEEQVWIDNKDFITGLKFKVDATSASSLLMNIGFRSRYYYTPLTSWFRILINGEQVGPNYNPNTINSDPITYLNISLSDYIGEMIDVELQQLGWDTDDNTRVHSLDISGTLSTQNPIKTNQYQLFPNPSRDVVYISGITHQVDIQIFDISGKEVINTNQTNNKNGIDTSNLSGGIYFVRINDGENIITRKLIKK